MSYHKNKIKKGILGEFSKIQEEFEELTDGFEQNDPILQLCELSDLLGAIEAYSKGKWNISLEELKAFSDKTKSSFEDGTRTSQPIDRYLEKNFDFKPVYYTGCCEMLENIDKKKVSV